MNTAFKPNLKTYGKRIKINLRYVAFLLILLCFLTPCTNWAVPAIAKKVKGVVWL